MGIMYGKLLNQCDFENEREKKIKIKPVNRPVFFVD